MRRLSLLFLLLTGTAQAADRVAYVERQVVRYEGDRPIVVTELVATTVSDSPVVVEKKAAPAVAATTFRQSGPVYNASHNCPSCGRSQYVISGGVKGGYHTHTCRYDGTVWYH